MQNILQQQHILTIRLYILSESYKYIYTSIHNENNKMLTWVQCMYKVIKYDGPCEYNFEHWGHIYKYVNQNSYPPEYINMHHFVAEYTQYVGLRKYNRDIPFYSELKYQLLGRLCKNPFLTFNSLTVVNNIFEKTQRTYFGISRFAYLWRVKRSKIRIDCDLSLNPINEHSANSMIIYQDGSKYMFKLSDLINICKSALIHANNFFATPLVPKNPYTNIEFATNILYEIYFAVRKSNYRIPTLLQLYYLSEFNIDHFLKKNEAVIRHEYIIDYVDNGDTADLIDWVESMLKHLKLHKKLIMDESFPNNIFLEAMRPFLKDYFISQYSLYKNVDSRKLFLRLKSNVSLFIEANPCFGRKIMIRSRSRIRRYTESFVTTYTPFRELNFNNADEDSDSEDADDDDDVNADQDDVQYETTMNSTQRIQELLETLTLTMNRVANNEDVSTDEDDFLDLLENSDDSEGAV